MKEFGGNRPKAKREEFTLKYEDVEKGMTSQVFGVIPSASAGDMAGIIHASKTGDAEVVSRMVVMLSKQMDDRDAEVRRSWSPKPLKQDEFDERPPSFRGPDGNLYPLSDTDQIEEWNDQKLWTSRRRFDYLMNQDDDAIVEMPDLEAIAEWLMGLAADRPTPPRV